MMLNLMLTHAYLEQTSAERAVLTRILDSPPHPVSACLLLPAVVRWTKLVMKKRLGPLNSQKWDFVTSLVT